MLEFGSSYAGAYLLKRGLFLPWELEDVLDHDVVTAGLSRLEPLHHIDQALRPRPQSGHARVATLESALYMRNQLLRDADWASMAHSIEVRVPFVDAWLLAEAARHTSTLACKGVGKAILARAPSVPLPPTIVGRKKTGFTTPVADWMRQLVPNATGLSGAVRSNAPWARSWSGFVAGRQCAAT